MKYLYDIPASFWGLFRSVNRDIYMEALLAINDEYQYNNYFLSREVCIQVLSDMCSERRFLFEREEGETEEEEQETLPRRILNWLVKARWLRKIEDFNTMTTNIVIPDYAAVFIEAFESLVNQPLDDTQIYIQNVYATLFSFKNDSKLNLAMLKTALVNTRKLNKALQDMLHNMDKFFERLLNQQSYGDLLREHLEGYVEEVVKKKYHILKTSDNFYIYKMDIKRCLKEMREDEVWIERIRSRQRAEQESRKENRETAQESGYFRRRSHDEDVLDLIDQIERGFDDIEHRIANMDKEHSKYVRATVSRLNYLLSEESDRKGLLIQLLNRLGEPEEEAVMEERIRQSAAAMNLSAFEILQENPLYKRRRRRKFEEEIAPQEEEPELSREEVLQLNKIHHRYSRRQIEEFIEEHMEDGVMESGSLQLTGDEDFEKLILAYDISMRRNSRFQVTVSGEMLEDGRYSYPAMMFTKRADNEGTDNEGAAGEGLDSENADNDSTDGESADSGSIDDESADADNDSMNNDSIDSDGIDGDSMDSESINGEGPDNKRIDSRRTDFESEDNE